MIGAFLLPASCGIFLWRFLTVVPYPSLTFWSSNGRNHVPQPDDRYIGIYQSGHRAVSTPEQEKYAQVITLT